MDANTYGGRTVVPYGLRSMAADGEMVEAPRDGSLGPTQRGDATEATGKMN